MSALQTRVCSRWWWPGQCAVEHCVVDVKNDDDDDWLKIRIRSSSFSVRRNLYVDDWLKIRIRSSSFTSGGTCTSTSSTRSNNNKHQKVTECLRYVASNCHNSDCFNKTDWGRGTLIPLFFAAGAFVGCSLKKLTCSSSLWGKTSFIHMRPLVDR